VLLERALLSYALDHLSARLYRDLVPVLVREEPLVVTGQFPRTRRRPTRCPPTTCTWGHRRGRPVGLHSGRSRREGAADSATPASRRAIRREAGSAGRDVRGLLRVHQSRRGAVIICAAGDEESDRWHAELLGTAEHLLQGLGCTTR